MNIDPSITDKLPAEAIQRVLYVTPKVHVYPVPPLTSNKGYKASTWTNNPPIATVRVRLVETAVPGRYALPGGVAVAQGLPSSTSAATETVKTTILLEDLSSGELFAAAPYVHPTSVQQAIDSSRFFAVRVVGDGGRKATLGVGFEERSEAFDFGVALQDASKVLGFGPENSAKVDTALAHGPQQKKDYSLKEGETIKVELGSKTRRRVETRSTESVADAERVSEGGTLPLLPPPPSAKDARKSLDMQHTSMSAPASQASELGFDDGDFGEFQ
ncbi:MAG: hypothetical protein M1828_004681 [Chrysothrix sp. TS-e1954]|nr:MAG: hypothetical protein M1828_004681 [Chrysothrix sp. TS-e1954]